VKDGLVTLVLRQFGRREGPGYCHLIGHMAAVDAGDAVAAAAEELLIR
jgi:hypothetical protein